MNIRLWNEHTAREINADELEKLFAEGLLLRDVAKRMKLNYSWLSRRINESKSLQDARSRGIAKSKSAGDKMRKISHREFEEQYLGGDTRKK